MTFLGIDWGDVASAGKAAFGVVHSVGKPVASAFGFGGVAQSLENLEARAGILPDWAGGAPAPAPSSGPAPGPVQQAPQSSPSSQLVTRVASSDYVVIVHQNGKTDVVPNAAQVAVLGGRRFDGNGYKHGEAFGRRFSFGIDQPSQVAVATGAGKATTVTDARQVLFCGGAESSNAVTSVSGRNDMSDLQVLGKIIVGEAEGDDGGDIEGTYWPEIVSGDDGDTDMTEAAHRAEQEAHAKRDAETHAKKAQTKISCACPRCGAQLTLCLVKANAPAITGFVELLGEVMTRNPAPLRAGVAPSGKSCSCVCACPGCGARLQLSITSADGGLLQKARRFLARSVFSPDALSDAGRSYITGTDVLGAGPRPGPKPVGKPKAASHVAHQAAVNDANSSVQRATDAADKAKKAVAKSTVKIHGDDFALLGVELDLLGAAKTLVTAKARASQRKAEEKVAKRRHAQEVVREGQANVAKAGADAKAAGDKAAQKASDLKVSLDASQKLIDKIKGTKVPVPTKVHGVYGDVIGDLDAVLGHLEELIGEDPPPDDTTPPPDKTDKTQDQTTQVDQTTYGYINPDPEPTPPEKPVPPPGPDASKPESDPNVIYNLPADYIIYTGQIGWPGNSLGSANVFYGPGPKGPQADSMGDGFLWGGGSGDGGVSPWAIFSAATGLGSPSAVVSNVASQFGGGPSGARWLYRSAEDKGNLYFHEAPESFQSSWPALQQNSTGRGWGPLVGNPKGPLKGLRYAQDTNQWFWFPNDAPDVLTKATRMLIDQVNKKKYDTDLAAYQASKKAWDAATAAGIYAAKVAYMQNAAKEAADAKKQAADDAAAEHGRGEQQKQSDFEAAQAAGKLATQTAQQQADAAAETAKQEQARQAAELADAQAQAQHEREMAAAQMEIQKQQAAADVAAQQAQAAQQYAPQDEGGGYGGGGYGGGGYGGDEG